MSPFGWTFEFKDPARGWVLARPGKHWKTERAAGRAEAVWLSAVKDEGWEPETRVIELIRSGSAVVQR